MLSTEPERLAALLAQRVEWVTGRPHGRPGDGAVESTVVVTMRSLDLVDLVQGAREFTTTLDRAEAGAWRRSWTRTVFLFGTPANLATRTGARVVAAEGTTAWLGPFPGTRLPGWTRLLKPVTGTLPELPAEVEVPGAGPPVEVAGGGLPVEGPGGGTPRVLHVAVAGLTLTDYLVHLHHTVAESVLLGRLRTDESLRLRHRPALTAGPTPGPPAYARVLPDAGAAGRLRLHTWLSPA